MRRFLGATVLATLVSVAAEAGARPSAGGPSGCTIIGTNGNDVLRGTPVGDVICGRKGDDAIVGGGGTDHVEGGPNHDAVYGDGVRTSSRAAADRTSA